MKTKEKLLNIGTITTISKILGHTEKGLTGTEISGLLKECEIYDPFPGTTKWKRIFEALSEIQIQDKSAIKILLFLEHLMYPVRYLDNPEWHSATLKKLNQALIFEGFTLGEDGKVRKFLKAKTIKESKTKVTSFRKKLINRNIHPDLLKFCSEELLSDNYFHAVFEAIKSIAEKIRHKTGLISDGSKLVDAAFSFNTNVPFLSLNSLKTEAEKSEQKGFINLLKGLFGTFRNTTAHTPKISWQINEQDALDILSIISLIHRRLDTAHKTGRKP